MILDSIADIKKYIAVSQSLDKAWESFAPYINKAVNQFTYKYVGPLHTTLSAAVADDAENATIKNAAREHLREALANFAMYLYMPLAQVQFDSSGITTAQNQSRKNAEWWQINDIRRDFLTSGHAAMDRLLEHLEINKAVFTDWNTNYGTVNRELIVGSTKDFDNNYNIFGSRQTYLALQPAIRQVEDQHIRTMICPALVEAMLNPDQSGDAKKVLRKNLQKAVVAFTIAKVCDEGMFLLDASGLKLKNDVLPSESVKIPDYGKQADQITRIVQTQTANGISYLKFAKKTIKDNPADFNSFNDIFINESKTGNNFSHNTNGVVGL